MSTNKKDDLLNYIDENAGVLLKNQEISRQIDEKKKELKKLVDQQKENFDFDKVEQIENLNDDIQRATGYLRGGASAKSQQIKNMLGIKAKAYIDDAIDQDKELKALDDVINNLQDKLTTTKKEYLAKFDEKKKDYIEQVYNDFEYKNLNIGKPYSYKQADIKYRD